MKILAIGTSNSHDSINRQLATYAARLVKGADVEVININDYELPIFSTEREKELGQPLLARRLFRKIGKADALVIAFAEHNGSYTAAWKNLFDWLSRINQAVFQHTPAVYLSTSPGTAGAASVLASAVQSAPFFAANVLASMALPKFHENFDRQKGIMCNKEHEQELKMMMDRLEETVNGSKDWSRTAS